MARRRRDFLTSKQAREACGLDEPAPVPRPRNDPIVVRVERSLDEGISWEPECDSANPVHALRLARGASESDKANLYRVYDLRSNEPMLHFRRGMPVYQERGWQ